MSGSSGDDARQWLWRFGGESGARENRDGEKILIFKKGKMRVVVLMAGL